MWGNGYTYGSQNSVGGVNWWTSGVPLNYAYQPSGLLSVDMGRPVTTGLPAGAVPMTYMMGTTVPLSDYTIIGNTSSTVLMNPALGAAGVPVVPTYVYYAYQGPASTVPGLPTEAVLARRFTKGLVLYRTNQWGSSSQYANTTSAPIDLGGSYRRVHFNGSLSSPVTSVTLSGYEGAIFVSAACPTQAPIPSHVYYCPNPALDCSTAFYVVNPAVSDATCLQVAGRTLCPVADPAHMQPLPTAC